MTYDSDSNYVIDGVDTRMSKFRLAGGGGLTAAQVSAFDELRKLCSTFLLFDDPAYTSSEANKREIKRLIPKCDPQQVADLALHIRTKQNIRHTPLFILRELFRIPTARKIAGEMLPQVILRADEVSMFLELYWSEGKIPLAAQIKKGLSVAINKFGAYGISRYKDEGKDIALRDVLHLIHARPSDSKRHKWTKLERRNKNQLPPDATKKEELFFQLSNKQLPVFETREVLLSEAKTTAEKKAAYEKLLRNDALGAQALLMNLRGMTELEVDRALIVKAMQTVSVERLTPLQFFSANQHAPQFKTEIEQMMFRCLETFTKLPGTSVLVLDVSGSMGNRASGKSEFTRMDAAFAMGILAREMCEKVIIYLTAGNDGTRVHSTKRVGVDRGFSMVDEFKKHVAKLGGGGIFTRQALEYIKNDLGEDADKIDRIMVFSDSQDCDTVNQVPKPFAKYNYIIDVSANSKGINFKGVWTAEIAGWSQYFLEYIAQNEEGFQAKLL